MKTVLVIMAAGIGSRFGGGIKQLAPVGSNGVVEYLESIYKDTDFYIREHQRF